MTGFMTNVSLNLLCCTTLQEQLEREAVIQRRRRVPLLAARVRTDPVESSW